MKSPPPHPPLLVLAGCTASGKTEVAARLAARLGGEVINVDPFQACLALPRLSAQPSQEETATAPHHLYGFLPLSHHLSAASFAREVETTLAEVRERGRLPVLVSGSGLYLRAVLEGFDDLPATDPQLRRKLDSLTAEERLRQLLQLDPQAAACIDLQNPRRVQRALEVSLQTGQPITALRGRTPARPKQPTLAFFLHRERGELRERILRRTKAMLDQGALQEVAALPERIESPFTRAIGIAEIRRHLAGKTTRDECLEQIAIATRQLAKKQESWFRKEPAFIRVTATPHTSAAFLAETLARRVSA
ncbi:MAG: tRNA (adenosine(37)-N6)-dimethylallyltransferase MiaA [Verrucomicrobiota bacterium]